MRVASYLTGVSNASSVPGSTQTATEQSSGAANPRVPVPKLCVTSFSPTLAGRVRTLCRLRALGTRSSRRPCGGGGKQRDPAIDRAGSPLIASNHGHGFLEITVPNRLRLPAPPSGTQTGRNCYLLPLIWF